MRTLALRTILALPASGPRNAARRAEALRAADGPLSRLEVRAGKDRNVRCGAAPCQPGRGIDASTRSTLAGIVLRPGERWSNRGRTMHYRHDALSGLCPPVP